METCVVARMGDIQSCLLCKNKGKDPLVVSPREVLQFEEKRESSSEDESTTSSDEEVQQEEQSESEEASEDSSDTDSDSDSRDNTSKKKCDIVWDGFYDEVDKPTGNTCLFCDNDLSVSPFESLLDEHELESDNLPQVAVLGCGHTYHYECLKQAFMTEREMSDPPCIICDSFAALSLA